MSNEANVFVILILLISATNHESLGFFGYLSKISQITFGDQHALYCLKPDCALGALIISSPSYMCILCSISGKTKSKIHWHGKKRHKYSMTICECIGVNRVAQTDLSVNTATVGMQSVSDIWHTV